MESERKRIIIIAGPNGAGKTTFAKRFLPDHLSISRFVNADEIAKGLAHFAPESMAIQAGRVHLQALEHYANEKVEFAFETTLSGSTYLQKIKQWQSMGYFVILFFLKLPSIKFAVNRVKERVKQGGHNIPTETISRRFKKGLENLNLYKNVVDAYFVYDNSSSPPKLLEKGMVDHEK